MQQRLLALFALGLVCLCQATPFLNTYLLPEDKQSLKSVFTKAFAEQQQDISAVHHAVGGLKFLGESLSAQDSQVCALLSYPLQYWLAHIDSLD